MPYGRGGSITVNGGTALPISRFEVNVNARLAENTTSANTGTRYVMVVEDCSSTIELPVDDTRLPDTDEGLTRGAVVTLVGTLNNSKTVTLTGTTVETAAYINDPNNDIVRYRVTTRGGDYTAPTT